MSRKVMSREAVLIFRRLVAEASQFSGTITVKVNDMGDLFRYVDELEGKLPPAVPSPTKNMEVRDD